MRTLVAYEMKKIVKKKSTIAVFLILFLLNFVFVAISGSLGSTYVDGEFYETHYERTQIDRENGIAMSGRKMDDTLLSEMAEVYQKIDWSTSAYRWTDFYKEEVRKYSDLEYRFTAMGLGSNLLSETAEKPELSTAEKIYALRNDVQEQMYDSYGLSEQDKTYWEKKDAEVEVPFTYQYAAAYESIIGGQGLYMICMFITFFIAITMVNVFTDEHNRKTDQLILCTRFGRGKVYAAKIWAGSLVTFLVSLLFVLTAVFGKFFSYGTEGFDAALQVALVYWYPYPISVGMVCLIASGLLLLSSVMMTIFAMVLAEALRNSIGALAVLIGMLFAARLVSIPPQYELLSRTWNFLPINMLLMDQGFVDLRLINLFGLELTTWKLAPILYVILSVIMIYIGYRIYKNYQVSGR